MKQVIHALLIEDSEDDAFLLLESLAKSQFDIQSKRIDSKLDLMTALEQESWEIILCNYPMIEFSGFEALSIVQQKGLDIPFIFVFGSMDEDIAVEAMHNGAHDFVMKGNLRRLLPAIERELKEAIVRTEKKRSEHILKESEERYHSLFDNMLEGVAYCQMLYENGNAIDFVYLSVNKAFATTTGLKNVIGKKVSEVIPGIQKSDPTIFEIYGRVTKTGLPERVEIYVDAMKEWFYISVYSPGKDQFVAVFDIITPRKRIEKALEHEQYLMHTLMDNIPDAIFYKDMESRFIRVSENLTLRLGIEHSENIIGKTDFDLFAKVHAQKAFDDEQKIIRTGVPLINVEEEEVFPDKDPRWVLTTKLPLRDTSGKIIGTFGISKDITERKKIEQNLRKSEERFKQVSESSGEWIWEIDANGRYTYANSVVEKILGYKPEELVGKKFFFDFFTPAERDEMRKNTFLLINNKENIKSQVNTFTHKSGRVVHLETNGLPILDFNGNLIGYRGADTDITERIQANEKLLESEKRFRSYFELPLTGIAITSPDKDWIEVNDRLCEILGYSEKELRKISWPEITYSDDIDEDLNKYNQLLENKIDQYKIEKRFVRMDGTLVSVDLAVGVVRKPDCRVDYIISLINDITERKRVEEELKKSEDKFRILIENLGEGVTIVDANEVFVFSNPAAEQIFGMPPGGLINRNFREFLSIDSIAQILEESEKRSRLEESNYEIEIKTDAGIKRNILIAATPQLNAKGIYSGTFAVFTDITDRKRADDEIKASEKRFRSYFELPLIGIAISSTDKMWIECNERLCEILGYSNQELIQMSWAEMTHPDDVALNEKKFNQILESEIDQYRLEKRFIRKDGSLVYTELVAGCVRNKLGEVEYLISLVNDISERKHAESELKLSLSLLKATLESTTDGILVVSTKGKITGFNSRFETIWKLPAIKISTFDDKKLIQIILPQLIDPESFLTKLDILNADSGEDSFDLLELKDGRIIEHYSIAQRLDDKVVGRVWSFRDITERKQDEEARIQSEKKYRELTEFLPSGIFETDKNGQLTYVNKIALEWTGYFEEELYSITNVLQLISEKDRKRAESRMSEIMNAGLVSPSEYEIRRKDGSNFPALIITSSLVIHGKSIGLRGVISDLTQYKQAENALKVSEESYRRIIETSLEGVLITDSNEFITFANNSMVTMLGYSHGDLIGMNMETIILTEDFQEQIIQIEKRRSGLKARYQSRFKKADGTLVWVEISASRIISDDGLHKGSFAMINDITQRLMSEKEVNMHRDHLEETVNERTLELTNSQENLKRAIIAAEAANRAKSEFLANMSHEIRTPMNAIIGFSDLLYASIKDDKQRSQVGSISRSARSLLSIINDILDLSKIEAGKFSIQNVPVDVYKLIKDIEVIFNQRLEEKGISFKLELSSEVPQSLLLDETRLRQILFNLIGNAVKFTETGYVKLTVNQRKRNEDIGKIDLIISVEDTGIGIPVDQQQLILMPFYQQKGQSTKKYGGTGLGLAITNRLVELMGGEIIINSEPGKGSTFEVLLENIEISDEELSHREEITFDPKTVIFRDAKVLIVDDNPENRSLISDLLEYSSLSLIEASNGKEAIELALLHLPDLILMDLVMPEMNGIEATLELKKNKNTKAIPVIAISASAMSPDLESSQKKIFDRILLKPVNLNELVDTLKNYIKYDLIISHQENDFTKESVIELSTEQISLLPEIIHLLESDYLPKFEEVMQNQLMDQMDNFGKDILSLGEKYSLQILIQIGKEICSYVDSFDITKLLYTVKQFPSIIEKLNVLNNKRPE